MQNRNVVAIKDNLFLIQGCGHSREMASRKLEENLQSYQDELQQQLYHTNPKPTFRMLGFPCENPNSGRGINYELPNGINTASQITASVLRRLKIQGNPRDYTFLIVAMNDYTTDPTKQ